MVTVRRRTRPPTVACDSLCTEYPCGDGQPMSESGFQGIAIVETFDALRSRFGDRSNVYIALDMFVYYRRGDASSRVAPDVFVVFGADGNHIRHSWIIWEEGGVPPAFVLEVGSESTWERDAAEKREIYAEFGVAEYWRFDPLGWLFSPRLIGERLVDGEYQPLDVSADDQGILRGHSSVLGLDICVRDSRLRLYDPVSETWLLNSPEKDVALRERDAELREAEAEIERLRAHLLDAQQGQS